MIVETDPAVAHAPLREKHREQRRLRGDDQPTDDVKFGHQPALDGLRAVAVIAVLFFHARFSWAKGGFLGVSTFFTLSGFLITTLLVTEHRHSGSISLRSFWSRRFRRLLPASWLTIGLVVLVGLVGVWDTNQLRDLRGDVPFAFAQLLNWHYVFDGRSYGASFAAPSPLEHFWSLAIEEQFYVVFPLLAAGALRWGRGKRWLLGVVMGVVAGTSLVVNAIVARGDASRAYFGTDARLAELAVGVVAALVLFGRWRVTNRFAGPLAGLAGAAALGGSLWCWSNATVQSGWLYPWGLVATMACSLGFIWASLQPGPVRAVLSVAPLQWIGRISYGVYLFHWPVFLWLTPDRTGWSQWPLFVVRVAVTLAIAMASYRFLEQPIRRRRTARGHAPWIVAPAFVGVVVVGLVVASSGLPAPRALDREAAAAEVVVPPPPTRVLVVGDRLGASLGLRIATLDQTDVTVTTDADPWCGVVQGGFVQLPDGTVERDSERCRGVRAHWVATEASTRPDVVVIWSGVRDVFNRRLSVLDPWVAPGDPSLDDLQRTEVRNTVKALGAGGATVVWLTTPPLADTEIPPPPPPPPPGEPGHGEYQATSLAGAAADAPPASFVQNDPARVAAWNALATATVRESGGIVLDSAAHMSQWSAGALDPERRTNGVGLTSPAAGELLQWMAPTVIGAERAPSPPPEATETAPGRPLPEAPPLTPRRVVPRGTPVRTVVVGDSVGLNVGFGIQQWRNAEKNDNLVVGLGGQLGCAVARGGSYRYLNEVNTLGERCNWAAPEMWPRLMSDVRPDVAVICSGIWEVADRLLPGDDEWRHVGDPVFDQYYLSELLSAIDVLGSQGATVVVLTYPHFEAGRDQGFTGLPESQPERVDHLNALIAEAVGLRPGVATVIDFQGWLASTPGGELDPAKRDDGVHFGDDWVPSLGAWLGPEVIRLGRGG